MDIDEFLDKELQEEKKEEIEKEPVVSEDTKEPIEDSKETDTIKHYFQIWNKVSEAKFKWDNNLYTELNKAANKVREELDKSLLTAGREKKAIKRLIGKALNELENKNYEAATKLYSEISNMRNKFPDFFLKDKKELNKEIFLLYEKLHDQIDLKFISDFKESIAHVRSLVSSSFSSLDAGDIEKAKNFYEKALGIYKDMPNGFLTQKMELGNQLLALYKNLSIQEQIKNLQQQLSTKERYVGSDAKLKRLSEIIKSREKTITPEIPTQGMQPMQNKTLLSKLIARKLDRAKINLKKRLYLEAKKNIEAVLKVDPGNIEAKQLLNTLPIQY